MRLKVAPFCGVSLQACKIKECTRTPCITVYLAYQRPRHRPIMVSWQETSRQETKLHQGRRSRHIPHMHKDTGTDHLATATQSLKPTIQLLFVEKPVTEPPADTAHVRQRWCTLAATAKRAAGAVGGTDMRVNAAVKVAADTAVAVIPRRRRLPRSSCLRLDTPHPVPQP